MRLQSHLPRLLAVGVVATVVSSAAVVVATLSPASAQRLRSPASSLVLAAPTVTCGASPQVNLSWTDSAPSATGTYRVMSNPIGGKQNAWSAGAYLGNVRTTTVGAANGSGWQFAIDALTSVTRDSNVVSITVNCPAGDGTAPSVPVITNIGSPNCSQIDLSWSVSTDTGGSGLAGYNLWRDNTFVKRVNAPATSTSDTGLPAATLFSYQVSAIDNAGNQSARSAAVTVTTQACTTNVAPTANAGADQSAPTLVSLSFNGGGSSDPDGSIASYAWNFGDGATASGVSVSHAYASSGSYTVTLMVTDNKGATGSDTAVATIANRPPTANAGPDQSATAGTAVSFSGSGSSDLDGTISAYSWNFGDGTTGTGVTTSHAYAAAGTFTATLTVTDNKGATASDTATITVGSVANVPPTANAGADQSALTLVSLTFNGAGSSDPDGTIASYAWTFGDGTIGSGVSASHTYTSSGVYTVTLTVTDNKGATATDTATATIANRPPVANAGPDQTAATNVVVNFNGSGTDPDGTIASYAWTFGDGTIGSGVSASHTYTSSGVYTVTLTVTDNKGATATDTASISITQAPNQLPRPSAGADVVGVAGTPLTLDGSASYDPDGTIVSYAWNFGDGTTGSGVKPTHTYVNMGSYVATLTVTDNNGAGASDSASVTINSASAPTIPTGVTATAASCTQVNLTWNPSTAAAGIQDYEVFRDGIPLYWSTTTSFIDATRMQMTKYSYGVAARDRNGTISAVSTFVFVMTPSCTGAGWYQWAGMSDDSTLLSNSMTPESIAIDSSGNSIVFGNMGGTVKVGGVTLTSAGSLDFFIAKYSPSGQVLWAKRFGDNGPQYGTGVAVDTSGNIYVTGWYFGTVDFGGGPLTANGYDAVVAKFSPTGAHLWSKLVGGSSTDEGIGIAVDSGGNVLLTGLFAGSVDFGGGPLTSAGGFDVFLAKYNTNGAFVWAKRMGGTVADNVKGVGVDSGGNAIVAGYFSGTANFGGSDLTSAGANDVFVAKYSAAGVHQWSERFGDVSDQRAYAVAADGAGNVAITGYYYGSVSFGGAALPTTGNGAYVFVAKLNASGGHVWSRGFGSAGGYGSVASSIAIDGSGNISIAGSVTESVDFGGGVLTAPTGSYDPFVAKYGPDGTYKWARRFAAEWDDHANGVAVDGNGNVFAVGDTTKGIDFGGGLLNNLGGAAGWIVKLNP